MKKQFLVNIKQSGNIYLTFDDGPDPGSTPEILQVLNKSGIKATFFLVGKNIEKYPDIVSEIIKQGHRIGQHGYNHNHPWKRGPVISLIDLIKCDTVMKRYTNTEEKILFRPPFGKFNLITLIYIWATKKEVIFWDIDPKDYFGESGTEIAQFVIDNVKPGSVILLHDGRQDNEVNDSKITVEALKLILGPLLKDGYTFTRFN